MQRLQKVIDHLAPLLGVYHDELPAKHYSATLCKNLHVQQIHCNLNFTTTHKAFKMQSSKP